MKLGFVSVQKLKTCCSYHEGLHTAAIKDARNESVVAKSVTHKGDAILNLLKENASNLICWKNREDTIPSNAAKSAPHMRLFIITADC